MCFFLYVFACLLFSFAYKLFDRGFFESALAQEPTTRHTESDVASGLAELFNGQQRGGPFGVKDPRRLVVRIDAATGPESFASIRITSNEMPLPMFSFRGTLYPIEADPLPTSCGRNNICVYHIELNKGISEGNVRALFARIRDSQPARSDRDQLPTPYALPAGIGSTPEFDPAHSNPRDVFNDDGNVVQAIEIRVDQKNNSSLQHNLNRLFGNVAGHPFRYTEGWWKALYASIITITTLGLGDVIPITLGTRILVMCG